MLNALISWHAYLLLNIAIMVSYLATRATLAFPLLQQRLTELQKLQFARFNFILTLPLFIFCAALSLQHKIDVSNIPFTPAFQHTARFINHSHILINQQLNSSENMPVHLPLKTYLIALWLIGLFLFGYHQLKSVLKLNRLMQNTYCQHQFKRLHILFHASNHAPFCWGNLQRNYIVLPEHLLENMSDKRLAIRHELQHIRQGDTVWLQLMLLAKLFFYCNPFLTLWQRWFSNLQEYACDEQIILRSKTTPTAYAQCLINAATYAAHSSQYSTYVIAINGISNSILYRRVTMLFTYRAKKTNIGMLASYALSFCLIGSTAFALNANAISAPITRDDIANVVLKGKLHTIFHITPRPEVIAEINHMRQNDHDRAMMQAVFVRMKESKPLIESALTKAAMPTDLIAIPMVESGFQALPENVNPVHAAGVWQFIPNTAKEYGLVINNQRDDRMDLSLSTSAAISYLNNLYTQFHDWKLAITAYEIGEKETARLIQLTGSHDAWTLAQSNGLTKQHQLSLKKYLAMFDATVILLHEPKLIAE